MISTLYEPFKHWSDGGSIYILSDMHFGDSDCKLMDKDWISPDEPVFGLPWCLNIHGHDHSGMEEYHEGCKHINLAANVCGYKPVNLGRLIKDGILSDIDSIHRITIDRAIDKKKNRETNKHN